MKSYLYAVLFLMAGLSPATACTVGEILDYQKSGISQDVIETLCGQATTETGALNLDAPNAVDVYQGVLEVFTSRERIAPLKIVTPSGGGNYFIKLVEADSGEPVLTAYIDSGGTLELDVPTGSYRIRYAVGDTWYGPSELFGKDTGRFEADDTFDFRIEGDRVIGHTIELIKQQGGNLDTKSLPAGEF